MISGRDDLELAIRRRAGPERGEQPARRASPACYAPGVWRWGAIGLCLLAAGCTCGGDGAERVEGPTPYRRCHLAEPRGAEERTIGPLTLRREERALTVEGLPDGYRVAVGAGPAEEPPPEADLVFLIGGDPPELPDGPPVFVVAGPDHGRIEDEPEGRIIDATVLRVIRAGPVEWVPVAGAPEGRYAASEDPCGLGPDDVEEWGLDDPPEGKLRALVSWAGPSDDPATRGLLGEDAGSALIQRIMEETDAGSALFAWPRTSLGRGPTGEPGSLVTAIAPISGPWVVRADGARVRPGWTVVDVSPSGLSRRGDAAAEAP